MDTPILEELKVRIDGICKILMAHHEAGKRLPSAVKGMEREFLVREFLANVFPPPYRFGSGAIIDAYGKASGQVDIVVEFPFLPSFPTPGARERLYLADSAALTIEVKSNLSDQWEQVRNTAKKVLPLRRTWRAHEAADHRGQYKKFEDTISRVPFLTVGYCGPQNVNALKLLRDRTPEEERPDGILVIESGAYSGCWFNEWEAKGEGPSGLLGFTLDVAWLASNVKSAAVLRENAVGRIITTIRATIVSFDKPISELFVRKVTENEVRKRTTITGRRSEDGSSLRPLRFRNNKSNSISLRAYATRR